MKPVLGALRNPVRGYAWGSHEVIARFQGRPAPTDVPEAELWFGAHPSDPSSWLVDGGSVPLDEAIARDPHHLLGEHATSVYGAQLPFLLKILAVAAPLSLQVHPSATQAVAGFQREERSGVPLGSVTRNYTDPLPKPELVRAVTRFDALCGFRSASAIASLLDLLAVDGLQELRELVASHGNEVLPIAVARLLRTPSDACGPLVARLAAASAAAAPSSERWAPTLRWIVRLAEEYPEDPGVLVALLLELVQLQPGESLHVPAGTLHSYLAGTAIEIMAASDSTLRGGLTGKHVDVDELLKVVSSDSVAPARPRLVAAGPELVHEAPVSYFRLSELHLDTRGRRRSTDRQAAPNDAACDGEAELTSRGPQILLCLEGEVRVEVAAVAELELVRGASAFVAAAADTLQVRGAGTLIRATVGEGAPPA